MSEVTDWISAIANSIVAGGLLLTLRQVNIASKELKQARADMEGDHERSRRERAIELFAAWARHLNQRAAASRKFSERLSSDQARALFNQDSFEVDEKYLGLLTAALSGKAPVPENGKIKLTEELASEIRWQIVTYLNNLEAILAAWLHNVADKQIIEEQYRFLISPSEGHYILQEFRNVAGGSHTYPAINEFVKHIREKSFTIPKGPITSPK